MIENTTFSAMVDELQKLAAPRWKVLLRQGKLDPSDVSRLTGAKVLDYGKEIAGLRKGTENIAKKKDIGVNVADWAGLKSGVQDWRQGKGSGKLKDVLRTGLMAAQGGGGLAVPVTKQVYLAPGFSRLLMGKGKRIKGQSREGLDALIARHEIDEIGAGQKLFESAKAGKLPRAFVPGVDPKGLRQKLVSKSNQLQMGLVDRATDAMRNRGMEDIADIAGHAARSSMPVRRGAIPAGRHMNPDVILRESRNVATLPSRVGQIMRPFREGEVQTMPGFQYGREAVGNVRKRIMGAFGRGEI